MGHGHPGRSGQHVAWNVVRVNSRDKGHAQILLQSMAGLTAQMRITTLRIATLTFAQVIRHLYFLINSFF